jgi:ABC-2 type transport system permease protein
MVAGAEVQLGFERGDDPELSEAVEQEVQAVLSSFNRAALAAQVSQEQRTLAGSPAGENLSAAYHQAFERTLAAFIDLPTGVKVSTPEGEETETGLTAFGAGHHNAGQLITWVFIPLLGTSVILTAERTEGTLRRLLSTPTGKSTFLIGTFVGQLIPAFFQYVLLILFGVLVMGVDWGSSVAGLVVMLLTFSLASVAFGAMLGTLTHSSNQANNLSIMAGMAMALLGGCWWPSELFPQTLQVANRILPTSWAIQGLSDLSLRGLGLVDILPEAGILLGFAVVFFVVGILRFRFE